MTTDENTQSTEYTPPTSQVRQLYANSMDPAGFDRWLAAEKAKWQAKERERIAAAIDDLEHDGEEARRLVRAGEQEVAWIDGYARAVFDAARIARQGGSDER